MHAFNGDRNVLNLRQIRAEKGWTQAEMAEIAGCSQSRISRAEAGVAALGADHIKRLRMHAGTADLSATPPQHVTETRRFLIECASNTAEAVNALRRHMDWADEQLSGCVRRFEEIAERAGAPLYVPPRDSQPFKDSDETTRLRYELALTKRERDAAHDYASDLKRLIAELQDKANKAAVEVQEAREEAKRTELARVPALHDDVDDSLAEGLLAVCKSDHGRELIDAIARLGEDDLALLLPLAKRIGAARPMPLSAALRSGGVWTHDESSSEDFLGDFDGMKSGVADSQKQAAMQVGEGGNK